MKKSLPLLFLAAILTFLLGSCDIIPFPYGKVTETADTVAYPPPAFTPNLTAPRAVLVEDYTGHTCGNCPPAADIIKQLVTAHPGQVVGLAIHAGATYAAPQMPDYPDDFRTPVGDAFDSQFGISSAGQPNGMVNRKLYNASRVVPYPSWSTKVNDILTASPTADADIQIKNYYDATAQKIVSYVYVYFIQNMSGNFKLAAYIAEDSVIASQKLYTYDNFGNLVTLHIEDYPHMHMLRGNISSIWGVQVNTESVTQGTALRKDFSMVPNPIWRPEHTKVVAVLYNADTYEIIQVAEKEIID